MSFFRSYIKFSIYFNPNLYEVCTLQQPIRNYFNNMSFISSKDLMIGIVFILFINSLLFFPFHGVLVVSILKTITPSDQMSLFIPF